MPIFRINVAMVIRRVRVRVVLEHISVLLVTLAIYYILFVRFLDTFARCRGVTGFFTITWTTSRAARTWTTRWACLARLIRAFSPSGSLARILLWSVVRGRLLLGFDFSLIFRLLLLLLDFLSKAELFRKGRRVVVTLRQDHLLLEIGLPLHLELLIFRLV